MRYQLLLSKNARQQLRALDKATRRNIGWRLEALRNDLQGDVRKLEAKNNRYRLRVGSQRVLLRWKGT